MNLQQWAEQAIPALLVKPSTVYYYRRTFENRLQKEFGTTPIPDITRMQIRRWVASMASDLKPQSVRNAYYVLRRLLDMAVEEGIIEVNPCYGITPPKYNGYKQTVLTIDQVHDLASATKRYGAVVLWQAYMGTRFSELSGLSWEQFDGDKVTIDRSIVNIGGKGVPSTTKTGISRVLTVPSTLWPWLEPWRGTDLVFTTSTGSPLISSNFSFAWYRAQQATGIKVRMHDLRHTCAALLISAGAHPKEIQMWLGHRSITTTMNIYGHLYDETGERLANLLDHLGQNPAG